MFIFTVIISTQHEKIKTWPQESRMIHLIGILINVPICVYEFIKRLYTFKNERFQRVINGYQRLDKVMVLENQKYTIIIRDAALGEL